VLTQGGSAQGGNASRTMWNDCSKLMHFFLETNNLRKMIKIFLPLAVHQVIAIKFYLLYPLGSHIQQGE
jgi:hypothetical protein